jgi:membrane protease YdiL (CAAX protease family)
MVKPYDWRRVQRLPAPGRTAPLVTLAALSLTMFNYWMRADQIASRPAGGSWVSLGGAPLPASVHWLAAGLLLGALPLLGAKLGGLRANDVGLGRGRSRAAVTWTAIGVPVAILAGRLAAADPAFQAVYPLDRNLSATPASFLPHAGFLFIYYAGWELLFRGVLLLGLRERLGDGPANALQTALSVTAHFARPFGETLSAIPAGLAFGAITLRTRTIWPVVMIHWAVGTAMDWFLVAG